MAEKAVKIIITAEDRASGAVKSATQSLESLGERSRDVAAEFAALGAKMAAVGAGIGLAVKGVVSAFSQQESAAAVLRSTMMTADGLSHNFERVNALAVELGNRLPGTTADFAKMASALMQLGVSEEAVLGGVGKAAAHLAVVMRMPYEQAAEVAAKLKEATGTAESEMLRFIDTIQRIGHQGVKSGEMMYAFARSAGALKQFGLQGEEAARKVATLYAQLIKAGASGETVGTGFAAILNRLQEFEQGLTAPAKKAKQKIESFGISLEFFDKQSGEFKGVDNLVAQFDKLRGLNQLQLGEVLKGIFGGGQDQQFAALLVKGGIEANRTMAEAIAKQADLEQRLDTQLDTLAAKWEAATGTFQNLLAAIGERMAPKLKVIVDWFNEIAAKAQQFVQENPVLAEWLGLAAVGTAATLVGGGAALLAVSGVVSAINTVLGSLKSVAAFFAAHPVIAAILGVAAVAAFTYAHWDTIVAGVKAFWDKIKSMFADAIRVIKDKLSEWKAIGERIVRGIIDGVHAKAQEFWDSVKALGRGAIEKITRLFDMKSPSRVFREIGEMAGEGLRLGLTDKIDDVADAAADLGKAAIRGVSAIDSKGRLAQRNEEIRRRYLEGASIEALAKEYGLSERWTRQLVQMRDDSIDTFAAIRQAGERAMQGLEDAFVSLATTGKFSIRSMVDAILSDLARITVRRAITDPLSSAIGSILGSLFGGPFKAAAKGDVLHGPGIHAYSGKIVDRPTIVPLARGAIIGEAGAEAVLPLRRGPDGKLGVIAAGGAGVQVTVNVHNHVPGAQPRIETRDEGGVRIIDVIVEQVEATMGRRVSRGEGLAPYLERRYGLSSAVGAYR